MLGQRHTTLFRLMRQPQNYILKIIYIKNKMQKLKSQRLQDDTLNNLKQENIITRNFYYISKIVVTVEEPSYRKLFNFSDPSSVITILLIKIISKDNIFLLNTF